VSHEIVAKGGTIVDGTGAEPFAADLAIDDGRITEIGGKIGGGRQVIDATAMVVSPGFVGIHTHLDSDKVAERQPELLNDFPGGAPRFIQRRSVTRP
jgi:N-acyl-D-amino-acid deacylase